jgi:hypothetical protein
VIEHPWDIGPDRLCPFRRHGKRTESAYNRR